MRLLRKIVIIGFMASGKSAVAIPLAQRLGLTPFNVDDEIVSLSGLPSIPAIFAERGEPYFRELEAEVAASLRDASEMVISTGGGIITRPENMSNLSANGGVVVYLRTSFETVAERAGELTSRPLFTDKANALELYQQRLPIYERYADILVDTDGRSVDEVCSTVISQLKQDICS